MSKLTLILLGLVFGLAGIGLWAYQHLTGAKSWKAFLGGILSGLGLILVSATPLPEGHVFQVVNGQPVPYAG